MSDNEFFKYVKFCTVMIVCFYQSKYIFSLEDSLDRKEIYKSVIEIVKNIIAGNNLLSEEKIKDTIDETIDFTVKNMDLCIEKFDTIDDMIQSSIGNSKVV